MTIITFTAEELSKTQPFTISELSKFIESKTNQEYVIVRKDFVKDLSKQLFENKMRIFEINSFINDNWIKIIDANRSTTDKWEKELKEFED